MRTVYAFMIVILACAMASCMAETDTLKVNIIPLPADAVKAEMEGLPQDAEWIVRTTTDGQSRTVALTTKEGTYKGKQVYLVSDGVGVIVLDKVTRNWISYMVEGKERMSAAPHTGEFQWPLFVGKSWTARFAYEDHVRHVIWNYVSNTWNVEAYEDVHVPAGIFKAFRIQSTPGENNGVVITMWYSPELKGVIKRITERTADHYLGPQRSVVELMEYHTLPMHKADTQQ